MTARLDVDRFQVLAFRRRVSALDERLPPGAASLRVAAWAGFTDSVPRAALLSIHARVEATAPSAWQDPPLVQLWGPRFSAYVVAEQDVAVFTLGRMPDEPAPLRRAHEMADRLDAFLAGRRMRYGEAGRGVGVGPNMLRYGTTTGRILISWDGARQPIVWTVSPPEMDVQEARLELARRHVHILGPSTADAFAKWAGIRDPRGRRIFDALTPELVPVRTPTGDRFILATDEAGFRAAPGAAAPARLLPSGDTFFLYWGADRELVVPDGTQRADLWTTRVWPGAVLVDGQIAGTWRRADAQVTIRPWRQLSPAEREAVTLEAESLPLPGLEGRIVVDWASERHPSVRTRVRLPDRPETGATRIEGR